MAKRGGKRRDPAREKSWRRTIREQQRSKALRVQRFLPSARAEGLDLPVVEAGELARRDQVPSMATGSSERAEAATAFLPVRVVDLEVVSPRPRLPQSRSCFRPA